jgi:hypothetical protein
MKNQTFPKRPYRYAYPHEVEEMRVLLDLQETSDIIHNPIVWGILDKSLLDSTHPETLVKDKTERGYLLIFVEILFVLMEEREEYEICSNLIESFPELFL